MKTVRICSAFAMCALLFTGVFASCNMGGGDDGGSSSSNNALDQALAASGDLSGKTADFTGLTATVSKAMVIKGASADNPVDMNGSTLVITADGVTLRYLKNVNVVTDAKLAEGSLYIINSQVKSLTVNGGGASSVYVNDTSVTTAKIAKAGVHVVFAVKSTGVTIGSIEVAAACNLETQADSGKSLSVGSMVVSSTDTVIQSTGDGSLTVSSLEIAASVSDITVGGCTITSLKLDDTTKTTIAVSAAVTITSVADGTTASGINLVSSSGTAVTTTGTTIPAPVTIAEAKLSVGSGTKTSYALNDAFSPSGLTVALVYSNGSKKDVSVASSDLTGFDTSAVGEKTVTVKKYGLTAGTFIIQVTDMVYAAETAHIKLETDPDGIKFTLTKQSSDFDWGYVQITQVGGGMVYEPDVINNSSESFIYPITEKDKEYYFSVVIEKMNDRHTTYREYVACKAGGGIGEVVKYNSAWKNAEETRSEEGDHRYIKLSATEDLKSIFTALDKISYVALVTEIGTGPNDWGSKTEFLTNTSALLGSDAYDKTYKGTLDMMNAADGWVKSPYEINAAIAKVGSYFTNSFYRFKLNTINMSGTFRTNSICSVTYLSYTSTAKKHVAAEACSDGIKFTITKQNGDFEWSEGGRIYEQTSDVTLFVNKFTESSETVIYPLVENGKSYTFNFYVEKSGDRHVCFNETLTCTAGGGIGNIVNYNGSVIYNTTLALSDSGSKRLVTMGIPSELDTTLLKLDEVGSACLHFDIASGRPDWDDKTEWVAGRDVNIYPVTDSASIKELAEGSDIFSSSWYSWSDDVSVKIQKLLLNTTYFAQVNPVITLAKYPDIPGKFRLRSIQTRAYTYNPVSKSELLKAVIE